MSESEISAALFSLYLSKKLPPLLLGGGQEGGLRSGTENLPMIAGLAAACTAQRPTFRRDIAAQEACKKRLQTGLSVLPGVTLLGAQDAPHVVNLAVAGLRSQGLINALQDRDICVSAGSACSKGHRSHVLEAMGVDPVLIDGSIRISLSGETTEAEVDALLNALPQAVDALRPSRGKHAAQ